MNIKKIIISVLLFIACILLSAQNLKNIKLPEGFSIDVFSSDVPSVRELSISPEGIVFAGSMTGNVYAVTYDDKTKTALKVYVIAKNLQMPVGVAFYHGDLYVSAVSKILKFQNIEKHLSDPPAPLTVNGSFPSDIHHGWKFIKFGPDKKLYVPVGAPCNVCLQKDRRYASIMRMDPDGTGLEIFAEGIRNTVGFDWSPLTGSLWFTDNGRDYLGDNIPPDELDSAPVAGMHFGFPFIHGKNIPDPEFGKNIPARKMTPPEMELGPHVASLGMRFYTGDMFPARYKNGIFIAEHGSWNRSVPIGYRITFVPVIGNKAAGYETFASGWLSGNAVSGRPADVEIMLDGSMLVSDDKAGAIYRISYR
jgi:glucose/arabinose dehydrogenase